MKKIVLVNLLFCTMFAQAQGVIARKMRIHPGELSLPKQTLTALERTANQSLLQQYKPLSKLVPIPTSKQTFPSTVRFDMRYIQKRIQSHGNFATSVFYDSEATLGLYRLIAKDIEGKLTAPEQIQLQYLFWHGHNPISEVERELQSWKDKWSTPPLLPTYDTVTAWIVQPYKTPRLDIQEEWALAAQIYILQKLYGEDLPEIIKNTNVIPEGMLPNYNPDTLIDQAYLFLLQPPLVDASSNVKQHYLNSRLHKQIQEAIKWQRPLEELTLQSNNSYQYTLRNPKEVQLIVLNAALGDINLSDPIARFNVLLAFNTLVVNLAKTNVNLERMLLLQQRLQKLFEEYLEEDFVHKSLVANPVRERLGQNIRHH